MNYPPRSAIQAAINALRECRELIQTDRTSLADSEMDPVTNTVPTDAQEMLDEYDSTLAHAEDAVQLLTAALSHPEPEAVQVPQGWRLVPVKPTQEMLRAGTGYGLTINTWDAMLAAAPQPPAQAEPCDMGPICIGCEPRGPRGECPGAQAQARGDEPTDFQLEQLFDAVHEHGEFGRGFREQARSILGRHAPAAPQAGEADSNFVWTMCKFIDYATGGRASKANTPLPVLKSLVDEHISELIDEATEEASQPVSREGLSPLADEQINELLPSAYVGDAYVGYSRSDLCQLARAIERAHGIGSGSGSGEGMA